MARARKRVDVERLNSPGPVKRTWVPRIQFDSEIIGAFAVSGAPGGDKDEVCTKAGLAKIQSRIM